MNWFEELANKLFGAKLVFKEVYVEPGEKSIYNFKGYPTHHNEHGDYLDLDDVQRIVVKSFENCVDQINNLNAGIEKINQTASQLNDKLNGIGKRITALDMNVQEQEKAFIEEQKKFEALKSIRVKAETEIALCVTSVKQVQVSKEKELSIINVDMITKKVEQDAFKRTMDGVNQKIVPSLYESANAHIKKVFPAWLDERLKEEKEERKANKKKEEEEEDTLELT